MTPRRSIAVTLGLAACTGVSEPNAPTNGPLSAGWAPTIIEDPARFAQLLGSSPREGWIALHGGDFKSAADTTGAPRRRALDELSDLENELSVLAQLSWQQTYTTWADRAGIPEGSAVPVIAALAAFDANDEAAAKAWLESGKSYTDPDIAAVAKQLQSGGLAAVESGSALADCVVAHRDLRAAAIDLDALTMACPAGPMVREDGGEHTRELFDPLIYGTLRSAYQQSVADTPAPSGLGAVVFSGDWTEADARSDGPWTPTITALGVMPLPEDDPESARAQVRKLDAALQDWTAATGRSAGEDGAALLNDLNLVGHFRSRALLTAARGELRAGHP
ncbi:MAG: hypothetical protein AAFV53_43695, partial [Myxococcota bacterium]